MLKKIKKSVFNVVAVTATFVTMITLSIFAVKLSTIFYILISGIAGVVIYLIGRARKEGKK
jgi:chromate transporter